MGYHCLLQILSLGILWIHLHFDIKCGLPDNAYTLYFSKEVFIGIQLLYNVVLVSAVQQSESALYTYTYIYSLFWISFPQGGKWWGGMNWEIGMDTYTLLILCIK